jgi:hypothetical protein
LGLKCSDSALKRQLTVEFATLLEIGLPLTLTLDQTGD